MTTPTVPVAVIIPPPTPPLPPIFLIISISSFLLPLLISLIISCPIWLLCMIGIFPFILLIGFTQQKLIQPPWLLTSTLATGLPPKIMGRAQHWYRGKITDPRVDYGLEYQNIEIPAKCAVHHHDYILRGWYIPAHNNGKKANTVIVCVHGAGRDRRSFMRHAPILNAHGYAVILMDCREHGLSDARGLGISYGVREAHDVIAVCSYARDHMQFQHIVAMGTSQGGGSCIIAATQGKGKEVIDAVIAENPFSSREQLLTDLIHTAWGKVPFPLQPIRDILVYIVVYIIRIRLGLGWKLISWDVVKHSSQQTTSSNKNNMQSFHIHPNPIDVISQIAPRPVFISHGTSDFVIPASHSNLLYDACLSPRTLWIASEAEHTALYDRYPEEWEKRTIAWLKQHEFE